jgi:hypothetical protein
LARENPLDAARKAMAQAYSEAKGAIRKNLEGTTPYNSVKLSDEDERMLYDFPERILPGGVGDRGMARQLLKDTLGAELYAKWIRKMSGV